MMKKVEKFITDNEIFKHGDSVVLGVSGGADSTCLLYVLNDLKEKLDLKLLVVHVNHGIRGEEADRDAMHVKKMCEKLNVPFRLKEVFQRKPENQRKRQEGMQDMLPSLRLQRKLMQIKLQLLII